jgi:hypothetical protein
MVLDGEHNRIVEGLIIRLVHNRFVVVDSTIHVAAANFDPDDRGKVWLVEARRRLPFSRWSTVRWWHCTYSSFVYCVHHQAFRSHFTKRFNNRTSFL